MADRVPQDSTPAFSSRMTRRLVVEAESILDGTGLSSESLDAEFEAISKATQSAASQDKQLSEDLVRLASLIDQSGGSIKVDGSFTLALSQDEMLMSLSLKPAIGTGQPVTAKDILDELRARDILRGVQMKAIQLAIDDADQGEDISDQIVVRGAPPIAGVNPWVAFFGRHPGGELEEVDEEMLSQGADEAIICEQDDTIAYIRQGDTGRPGYTAAGKELLSPPPKNTIKLEAGRNVIEMGGCYIAEIEGAVILKDDCLSVQLALIFHRDLDTHDSPLMFVGSIFVHGGVRSGVVIEATEHITIDRVVEGAQITSTGGNVVLQAGITGRNKGRISAAKSVTCGFVENASVTAGEDIILYVGALNSQLTANRNIIAETGRGGITGGVVMAGRCVRAKRIGSCGAQTIAMGGISTQAIPEIEQLNARMVQLQDRVRDTIGLIAQFDRAVRDPNALSPHEKLIYINLHKLRMVTDQELDGLKSNLNQALAGADTDTEGCIMIHQSLDANVTFHIGPLSFAHRISKGPLTFSRDTEHNKVVCRKNSKPCA